MLEAVRLVIPGDSGRSNAANLSIEAGGRTEEQALVIGLGIGTASTALTAHGIKTTTVELDPAVVRYATQYFGLPSNHTSVVEDAMTFVDKSRRTETELAKYDYIIHDVFTGGAEPVELFSWDFLKKLRDLLKPNGVIAINYAGDLAMPSASWVVETIQSIYPACRIFREDQAPTEPVVQDFTNLVIFCSNSGRQIAFRDPVEADFLGSHARRHYLLPRYEVESQQLETTRERFAKESVSPNLEKWQRQSAVGHWSIMRTVMPDAVWENW
ncbi:MAG: hypothetical protein M1817_000860 [Caeruleum heppii]|nr:MAG: hypothetical protein M1817_000860 [Caeruleum heppii]